MSKANLAYNKKTYERIALDVKKGNKDILKEIAGQNGETMTGYLKKAIEYRYFDDTGKKLDL